MTKLGKVLLILSGLILIVGGLAKFLIPDNRLAWIPIILSLVLFLIEVGVDFRLYKEFFGLKTTKHGMNMGIMILLVFVLLVAVNFVAVKKNIKWDLTTEKINSLSDQTVKLLKSLDQDLRIYGFFREDSEDEMRAKMEVKHIVDMLQDESSKIKFESINAIKRPDLVKEYNVTESPVIVFKYKDKTTSVTELTEEALANAIVKVTRERNKTIYYLSGHGEVDLEDIKETKGAGLFKKALQDSSYDVLKLSLLEKPQVPETADVVMILGPKQALLEPELKALEDFAARGGNLFIAADPGQRHNLGKWLTKFGVTFDNNYIIDQVGQLVGQSAIVAIGMQYSATSEITKPFQNQITAFELASSLTRDPKASAGLQFDELVKSSPASFSKMQLSGKVNFDEGVDKKGPLTVAMSVTGQFKSQVAQAKENVESDKAKTFSLVVFGDSDFLSNRLIQVQLNRDLALNAASFLAKDDELISIKPKQLATTKITMTQTQANLLIFGLYMPIPLLVLVTAGVIWFRRRGA